MHAQITQAVATPLLAEPREAGPGLFQRVRQFLFTWIERQRVLDELNRLTDRELADIGLSRGDFHLVFDEPPARHPARNSSRAV
jgi:uncharacterized protein YjiS (DUF1127 family)